MSKVLFAISLMVLLSCGTGESGPGATGSTSDTPPVSAMAPSGDAAAGVEGEQVDAQNAEDQAALAAAQEKTAAEAASGAAADAATDAAGGTGN